ncbi:sulfotransferase domain protein [Leptolyngbya sp. PCC 7375]|nr:sulfotransferase domain protein [Leptolyngbya sp. PCC 7375]
MLSNDFNNFALIIGAMKSGTTTLFDYLAQHPEISQSTPKEPNFFACDTNFSQGIDWYRGLWNFDPNHHKIALEASTHYTKIPGFPNAAERIESVEGNFKFIYILRDPIERIESQYTHSLSATWKLNDDPSSQLVNSHAINVSRYAKQIKEYYNRFPAESILLLDFNDLKQRPLQLLAEVCRFLEIDPDFQFTLKAASNKSKGKIIDGPMWHLVGPLTKFLPDHQRNQTRRFLGKTINQKVHLSDKQREFVLNELKDDLLKLKSEYSFDISKWKMYF